MKFRKQEEKSGSGAAGASDYVKLKDGEAITLILRGEIYSFYSVYGKQGEALSTDYGAAEKHKVNVIINEGGVLKAKIFQFSGPLYTQFVKINERCEKNRSDITKHKVKVARTGSGAKDTRYSAIENDEPLSLKVLDAIEKIPLITLGQAKPKNLPPSSGADDFGDPPPESAFEDIPF